MDTEATQLVEAHSSLSHNHPSKSLENIIENEFAHLSMNTFTYELKPLSDKMSKSLSSIDDVNDLSVCDYELTCRFIEINMPVVPLLKMKLTIQYPNEPPEVLSLTSTTMNLATTRSEKSGKLNHINKRKLHYHVLIIDDFSFFELISRNFIYFLFKLPTQHTVTDILDIWVRYVQNKCFSFNLLRLFSALQFKMLSYHNKNHKNLFFLFMKILPICIHDVLSYLNVCSLSRYNLDCDNVK